MNLKILPSNLTAVAVLTFFLNQGGGVFGEEHQYGNIRGGSSGEVEGGMVEGSRVVRYAKVFLCCSHIAYDLMYSYL